ncbi:MAG TPA: hypothetical protein VGJ07_24245 [Rugosimonospora sp.]
MARLRPLVLLGLVAVVAVGALLVLVPAARARLANDPERGSASTSPSPGRANVAMQAAPPPPTLRAAPVTTPAGMYLFGWALLDLHTGTMVGSANRDTVTNTTESMVKAWLAADYLRRLGPKQPTQQALSDITLMIEDSNDQMADKYYNLDGGPVAIQRLIATCKLTHTSLGQSWSYTEITPADAARYGRCVGTGVAAGATWTQWLLDKMRHVRGTVKDQISKTKQGGRWGIIDGLPASLAQAAAIKNGWTYIYADARWHINCMAILPDSVLAVEMQFAGSQTSKGLQVGADACASVARQLVYAPEV